MAKSQQRNPSQDLPTAQAGRAGPLPGASENQPASQPAPAPPVVQDTDDVPDDQRAGALAVVSSGTGLLREALGSSKAARWGDQRVASSLPISTHAERLALYAAIELEDGLAKDNLGKVLDVVHWCQYDFYRPHRETGEIEHKVRTVLICADGRAIGTGSDSAAKGLRNLLVCMPALPWHPPQRLKFASRSGKNGDYYVIDPRV